MKAVTQKWNYGAVGLQWQNGYGGPGIKCGLRTCGPADRQRYNLRTKNLRTVTADHGIKCGLQFADQTGVEVLNDRSIFDV